MGYAILENLKLTKLLLMILQMLADKRADEIITVIISTVKSQREILIRFTARFLQSFRVQLLRQELIVHTLIDQ